VAEDNRQCNGFARTELLIEAIPTVVVPLPCDCRMQTADIRRGLGWNANWKNNTVKMKGRQTMPKNGTLIHVHSTVSSEKPGGKKRWSYTIPGAEWESPSKVVWYHGQNFLKADWQAAFDAGRTTPGYQDWVRPLFPENKGRSTCYPMDCNTGSPFEVRSSRFSK